MNTTPNILLLHGKNCSGKSTIAEETVILGRRQGIVVAHIPLGDLLRAIAEGKAESSYSQGLQSERHALKTHQPATTQSAMGVFKEQVETHMNADLIIANGVPRYQSRLPEFRKTIDALGVTVIGICQIMISDEIARERSKERARQGDNFEERLAGYYKETAPTIELLRQDYLYRELDGTADIAKNAQQLLEIYSESLPGQQ